MSLRLFNNPHFKQTDQKLLFIKLIPDLFFIIVPLLAAPPSPYTAAIYILIFFCNIVSIIIDAAFLNKNKQTDGLNECTKGIIIFGCIGKTINSIIKNRNQWLAILASSAFHNTYITFICLVIIFADTVKNLESVSKMGWKLSWWSNQNKVIKTAIQMLKSLISICRSTLPFLGIAAAGNILLPSFIAMHSTSSLITYALFVSIFQLFECYTYISNVILHDNNHKNNSLIPKNITYIALFLSISTRAIGYYAVCMLMLAKLQLRNYFATAIAITISGLSVVKFVINANKSIANMYPPPPLTEKTEKNPLQI